MNTKTLQTNLLKIKHFIKLHSALVNPAKFVKNFRLFFIFINEKIYLISYKVSIVLAELSN
ncbi:hypothetical protein BpHYR1_045545 [Brachionus plicatilis]|uniref:Uncharacterized protein n=1 Tax=Brachionus plicatilis TaxID=10195 RepID=A0A3M7Q5P7_BRAPC|nr:hypothetical protein BpHYR1_045545 [Brachionus plicatilis]